MEIENLTLKEIRQVGAILGLHPSAEIKHPFAIGKNYFIRTVTHHHTGRLVEVTPTELVLEDAAWIADSGRFSDALKKCEFSEVEPFPAGRVIIGRGALVDAVQIDKITISQK